MFITYKGDHDPPHVHIYRDGKLIAKWNLQDWVPMRGEASRKILKILEELVKKGEL